MFDGRIKALLSWQHLSSTMTTGISSNLDVAKHKRKKKPKQ